MQAFEVGPDEIEHLDPSQFVDLVNHLANAECSKLGIPPKMVLTSSEISAPDQGVDCFIDDSGLSDARWVPPGVSVWQF